ncbi:FUSC family protein [bacterium]|nr:FUSC family protein [bacterium]
MPRPAPLFPAALRQELAPTPGRWRQSLLVAACSSVGLLVATALQFATFPAPLLAFRGALPTTAHSVALLLLRLAAIAGGGIAGVWLAGVAVQVPWLLLPAFFLVITALMYMVPIRQNPVAGYCLALMVVVVTYGGIFAPLRIGETALTLGVGFAIGILVSAGFWFLRALPPPRQRLAVALAAHFTRLRRVLAAAGARFRAAEPLPTGAETPPLSALATHLQLLSLVRMQHGDPELARAFVSLITAGERLALFVETADQLSRLPGGRTMRRLCDRELGALLDAVDDALGAYALAAHTPTALLAHDLAPAAPWPDFDALVAALLAREQASAGTPAVATVDVAESATFHGFAQALQGAAEVLHAPPEAREALPPDGGPPAPRRLLPPFDAYAAQFAAKIGLACTLSLLIGVVAHQPALETAVLNPLILAQGSYGATLRQTWLRLGGVLLGGVVAVLTVIAFMANTNDVALWLLFFFLLMLPCAYVALGGVRYAYLGQQSAITFMIIMVAQRPVTDPHEALWRFFGTVIGAATLFGVFAILAPDYAGRQIVGRFADLLRLLLDAHPPHAAPAPPAARARALQEQITAALADVLRLIEEARYEGAASGVDPDAAAQAAGQVRRIAHRLALARRSRRDRPPLPAAAAAPHAVLDAALRARLQRLLAMLDARHHRDRPGSPRHAAACAAARAVAGGERRALDAPLAAFVAAADAVRHAPPSGWTRQHVEALMAEVGHLQRICALLPALEEQLERTILPDAARLAAGRPMRPGVAALLPS